MKGKQPKSVRALREDLLADDGGMTEYAEQQVISELGGLLGAELEARHITQIDLSRTSGIGQPDINALVRGRAKHIPTVSTMRRLSRALGRTMSFSIFPDGEVTVSLTKDERSEETTNAARQEAYSSTSS